MKLYSDVTLDLSPWSTLEREAHACHQCGKASVRTPPSSDTSCLACRAHASQVDAGGPWHELPQEFRKSLPSVPGEASENIVGRQKMPSASSSGSVCSFLVQGLVGAVGVEEASSWSLPLTVR